MENVEYKVETNTRFYDKSMLDRAIENYKKTEIDTRRSIGEFKGNDPFTDQINLITTSHIVTSLRKRECDGVVLAGIEPLKTPSGIIVKDLLDSGKAELSMRMTGTINNDNSISELKIISVDVCLK